MCDKKDCPYGYPPPSMWMENARESLMKYKRISWWKFAERRHFIRHAVNAATIASNAPPGYEESYWKHHLTGAI